MKRIIGLTCVILFILIFSSTVQISAQDCRTRCCEEEFAKLVINGEGRIETLADKAYFQIKVRVEEKRLTRAFESSTEKINSISNALKSFGIDKENVQNLGYIYHPLYEGKTLFSSIQKPTSYEVIYILKVTANRLEDLGKILAELSEVSETTVFGLTYTSSKIEELRQEVLKKAAADARQKATKLTEGAGATLGKVMRIESSVQLNLQQNREEAAYDGPMVMKMVRETVASPDIEAGYLQIIGNATVTYALAN